MEGELLATPGLVEGSCLQLPGVASHAPPGTVFAG